MISPSRTRYSYCDETNRKPWPQESPVQQMDGFIYNYDFTQSTPRSLRKLDRLSLDDINEQVNAEWNTSLIAPSTAQAMVPRRFNSGHQDHVGKLSETLTNVYRRHSEPHDDSLHTGRCHQTNRTRRSRQSSPLTKMKSYGDWIYAQECANSDNDEMPSPRDSISGESKVAAAKPNDTADEGFFRLEQLNRKVLFAMETQSLDRRRSSVETTISNQRRDSEQTRYVVGHEPPVRSALASEYIPTDPGKPPYQPLNRPEGQIRLFRLEKTTHEGRIRGSFVYSDIKSCPKYTALSYAWGESTKTRKISIGRQDDVEIGENLWWFLHCRSLTMKKPRLFWIDAICIDQSNVHERNHQVGLMKKIYSMASRVYIWLGRESENSRLAMDFLANEGVKPLKRQIDDYRPIWNTQEGKAIRDLCERSYWRRMWVIQEIIHANKITVWCGSQRLDWPVLDKLYLTLKTLEEENCLTHHEFVADVLRSPAFVMVWQRAHWRHPETPTPKLQTLIEIFQGWECTDVRDKVYALVSMADQGTAVIPDYSRSPRQIYHDVLRRGVACDQSFCRLLAQVLRLHAGNSNEVSH